MRIGTLKTLLPEASGVAASRQFPGRLYHINDSGDAGNFYITDMDGSNAKAVRVSGFQPQDTEALSLGPCPGDARASCIYIGDVGDNDKNRKSVEIVIVNEVRDFPAIVTPRARLKVRYSDGSHDTESLAVHPNGTIYLLTKERPGRLFKVNPKLTDQMVMPFASVDTGTVPTDMTISDDGTRLLVLTYNDAIEYSMDLKESQRIRLNFLQQQESVAYLPGSRSFIYTTERLLPGLPQWIMRADCAQ